MKTTLKTFLLTTALSTGFASAAAAQSTQSTQPAARTGDAVADAKLDAEEDTTTDDRSRGNDVVVTGSRIVNPNLASAAPIQTVSAQEIKLSGAVNIDEVLNRLPQVVPYAPQADDEGSGAGRFNLRQIGGSGGGGLVLIDGQRIGAGGVDSIPPALIERVDILTGGAAAVYGPDAITGVGNFILKKNFDGVQIDLNRGFYNHVNRRNIATATADNRGFSYPLGLTNDGAKTSLNISIGKRLFDDRLSLSGYFSYREGDTIRYSDRSTQACHLLQSAIDATPTCDTTLYSPFGYILAESGPNNGTAYVNTSDGTRTFRPYRNTQDATTDRASRMGDSYQLLHGFERYSAGGFLNFKVTDAAEVYGSFMYNKNKSQGSYTPTTLYGIDLGGSYQLNCNNPLLSAQQAQLLCGTAAGTAANATVNLGYRFNLYPARSIDYGQESYRATAGVRGDFAGAWHYDIGGVWAKGISTSSINRNWTMDNDRVQRALQVVNVNGVPTCVSKVNGTDPSCVPLDVFRGYSNDPATYQYIFQNGANGPTKSTSYFVDVIAAISGDLGHYGIRSPLATDGIQVAVNAEYRRDNFVSFVSSDYNTIIQGTPNPSSISTGRQSAREIATEIQIPIVQDRSWTKILGFSGGYRASNYSVNKSRFFSTWKLEGTWGPTQDIRFRVARNFASRAPNSGETSQNINYSRSLNYVDPCGLNPAGGSPLASLEACKLQPGFIPATYGTAAIQCPTDGCIFRSGVSEGLEPQTANTLTYGLVLTPRFLPRFSFSVDHYEIRYVNQIVSLDPNDFTSNCINSTVQPTDLNRYSCTQLVRNANGTLFGNISNPTSGFVNGRTINVPLSTGTTGYDFQAHYDLPLWAAGRLAADFNGGIVTSAASTENQTGNVGYFGTAVGNPIPKWRHNLRMTFTGAGDMFQLSGNWRFISGTTSGDIKLGQVQNTFARIPDYSYFDLSANVTVAKRMTLGVTINNLLDKDPPLIPARGGNNSYSINGWQNAPVNFYDIYGRYIQFNVTTRF